MPAPPRIRWLTAEDGGYNWINGAETLETYEPGGYHPVMIDDLLHQRYRIVDKLGYGGYSTIWLAQDGQEPNRYVALKVGVAGSLPNEIKVLRALSTPSPSPISFAHSEHSLTPEVLDGFEVHGPNGTHPCYTTNIAQGNLREASFSRLLPTEVARALAYRLTMSVAYIHSRGYVHGDIHLQNILVKLPPSSFDNLSIDQFYEQYGNPETVAITRRDGKPLTPNVPPKAVLPLYLGKHADKFTLSDTHILLSDFGESFDPASVVRMGKDSHIPISYRPPEARFEPDTPLSFSADIWSLAIAIWEIIGMKNFSLDCASQDEIHAQHIDLLGPMPRDWWQTWEARSEFFNEDGAPKKGRDVWFSLPEGFEEGVQKYRREDSMEFDNDEAAAILELLRQMLLFKPGERLTAEEVLKSEWMNKWGLPCYEKSLREQQ